METNSLYLVILKHSNTKLYGGLFYYDDALDLSIGRVPISTVLDTYTDALNKVIYANFNQRGRIGFQIDQGMGSLQINDGVIFKLPISIRTTGWNNALS